MMAVRIETCSAVLCAIKVLCWTVNSFSVDKKNQLDVTFLYSLFLF